MLEGEALRFRFSDGGRSAAGYRGQASDCVCRAVAIATSKDYKEVYDALNTLAKDERPRGRKKRSSAREGVARRTYDKYLRSEGWRWVPTMQIDSGCQVHLREGELLSQGRLVVRLSKHLTAVVDGVIHDTHDPSRDGTRCVYGYYVKED